MIPGSNILASALRVISASEFQYYRFITRTLNEIGLDVAKYANPVPARGSVQPVARNLYLNLGLEWQKNYFNFYLEKGIIDVARDVSGDQFEFNCKRYQCLSKTDWYGIDNWDAVLCVEVPCAITS